MKLPVTTTRYKQVVTTRYEPRIVTKYVQVPVTKMVPADLVGLYNQQAQTPMPVPATSLIQNPQPAVQQLAMPQPVQPVSQSVVMPQPVVSQVPQTSMISTNPTDHFVNNYPIYENDPRRGVRTSVFDNNSLLGSTTVDDFRSRTSLNPLTPVNVPLSTSVVGSNLPGLNTSIPAVKD